MYILNELGLHKNINICPSLRPTMASMPIFGLKYFYGSSGDYHLSISQENSQLSCLFPEFDFFVPVLWGNERGRHQEVRGLETRPRRLPTGWTFCDFENIFSKFPGLSPEPSTPLSFGVNRNIKTSAQELIYS